MNEITINPQTSSPVEEPAPVVRPHYTVRPGEGTYEVSVVLPGVKRGDVSLRLEEGMLHIAAKRRAEVPEGWRPLRREIGPVDFLLDLQVNVPVDGGRITAKLEDGVLNVRLPLREEAQPRQITVD